jgi:hypothetical protein
MSLRSTCGEEERYKPADDLHRFVVVGVGIHQDPAALRLDGTTDPQGDAGVAQGRRRQADGLGGHGVGGAVQHEAERALSTVLAEQDDGPLEVRIGQLRHRHEQRGRERVLRTRAATHVHHDTTPRGGPDAQDAPGNRRRRDTPRCRRTEVSPRPRSAALLPRPGCDAAP